MLQTLRDNTKIILWVTIIAFVGLIILVWGADLNFNAGDPTVAGSVNGRPISRRAYDNLVRQNLRNYQSQNERDITFDEQKRLSDQAWELLVNEALIADEAEHLGLPVSDDEVVFWVKSNPPVQARQHTGFQDEGGNFDQQKYLAAIQASPADWTWYEDLVRAQLPSDKLRQLVINSAKVSDSEVEEYLRTITDLRVVSYARVDPGDFSVDEAAISESDVEAYYQSHLDEFQSGERARLRFIRIDKTPSEQDEAEILSEMNSYQEDTAGDLGISVEQGRQTFSEMAAAFSEGSYADQGGDWGAPRSRDQVRPDELAAAVFETPIGALSNPVRAGNRFYLVLVTGEEDDGSRTFSTIERTVEAGAQTLADLRERARDLGLTAKKSGVATAAQAGGFTVSETDPFTQSGFVPDLLTYRSSVQFAFQNEVGQVGGPDESEQGWLVYEVSERLPAEPFPFDQVAAGVRRKLIANQQRAAAKSTATTLESEVTSKGLDAGAKAAKIEVVQSGRFSRRGSIAEVGPDVDLIASAFELAANEVSGLLDTDTGFYIVRTDSLITPEGAELAQQRDGVRLALLQNRQLQVMQSWIDTLRESAKIVDERQLFF